MDLILDEGAVITVESIGRWDQESGGTIRQRINAESSMQVEGELTKQDPSETTVEMPLTCSGTLTLYDGVLPVSDDFLLTENGLIRGGGLTAACGSNVRLKLSHAPSAIIAGAIEPEHEGSPAWLDIEGSVTLTETTVVRVELEGTEPIRAKRICFPAAIQMAGTLEVTLSFTPDLEEQFKVVPIIDGGGAFTVSGADGFDVTQDASGVFLEWTEE